MSYSTELFSPLLPALRSLSAQDRLGLQNDAFALVGKHYKHTHRRKQVHAGVRTCAHAQHMHTHRRVQV